MNTKVIIMAMAAVALGAAAGWNAPRQSAPANLPVSAAATAPADTAADKKALYYACPMHPNIHYDHPGDCPLCGMKLKPVYANETNAPVTLPGCCGGGTCR